MKRLVLGFYVGLTVLCLRCQNMPEPDQVDPFISLANLSSMASPYAPDTLPEDTREVQEPIVGILALKVFCTVAFAIVTHHLCEHGAEPWWDRHCPGHTTKKYVDPWALQIKTKRGTNPPRWFYEVDIKCDALHEMACGTLAVGGGEIGGLICKSLSL